jgi:hypothetical protein
VRRLDNLVDRLRLVRDDAVGDDEQDDILAGAKLGDLNRLIDRWRKVGRAVERRRGEHVLIGGHHAGDRRHLWVGRIEVERKAVARRRVWRNLGAKAVRRHHLVVVVFEHDAADRDDGALVRIHAVRIHVVERAKAGVLRLAVGGGEVDRKDAADRRARAHVVEKGVRVLDAKRRDVE